MNKDFKQYLKIVINLVIAVAALLVIVLLVPKVILFFIPFLIGWIIASIANPFVSFLEKKLRIRRKATSVFVIVLAITAVGGALYLLVSELFKQGVAMLNDLPGIWENFEQDLEGLSDKWNVFYKRLPLDVQTTLSDLYSNFNTYIGDIVNKLGTPAVSAVGNFVKSIPSAIISIIMCLISSYYFVAEREEIYHYFRAHMPLSIQQKWQIGFRSMKRSVGGYFLAQFRIELWIYMLLVVGLMILRVKYAFLLALLIAVLDLLPVFGTGTILVPWAVFQLFAGNYQMAVGLLIIWGVGQLVRQLIQPKFIGDTVGVKPLPTLFLLYIGYRFFGVIGMIIAVPVGMIIMNLDGAGVFNTTKNSVRLLVKKVNDFRKFDEEDLNCIREDEPVEDEEEHDQFSFSDESVDEIDWINDNRYNDIKRELIKRLRQIREKEQEEKEQSAGRSARREEEQAGESGVQEKHTQERDM
ncbi:MAG: sporulation integral membrane protein YtvI [bacterium]|nr:sporulation integral membrane protein YtvI [bacterium]